MLSLVAFANRTRHWFAGGAAGPEAAIPGDPANEGAPPGI
jgi:hypothetical protein